jgi:hypothetical protein
MTCKQNQHGRSSILSTEIFSLICLKQGAAQEVEHLADAKESIAIGEVCHSVGKDSHFGRLTSTLSCALWSWSL